jgi:hypothetical protein
VTVGKRFILLAGTAFLLLASSFIGSSQAMTARHACVVPKVASLGLGAARKRILKANCRVGNIQRRPSTTAQLNHVLGQKPGSGRKLRSGSRVNLVVGDGPSTQSTENVTVTLSGKGVGRVTSSPAGISCGSTCSRAFAYGTTVMLTATPASNSTFSGWSGACAGTGSCRLVLSRARSATATFSLKPAPPAPPVKILAKLPARLQDFQTFSAPIKSASPPSSPNALRFNFVNSVGVALPQSPGAARYSSSLNASPQRLLADTSSPELESVNASGQVTPAITSGSANVSQFLVAPTGDLYVLFTFPVNLDDTTLSGTCLLAQVDPATGVPTCVDDSLTSIAWPDQSTGVSPAVQVGQDGSVYYAGYASGGNEVLRKYLGGVTTNLINANITINDFLVLPDGGVLLSGTTTSTGASWLRQLAPTGALQGLASTPDRFMRFFPDGNVYVGLYGSLNTMGVKRLLTGTDQFDPKYWISNQAAPDKYYDINDFCSSALWQERSGFCGWIGAFIRQSFEMPDGKMFVLAGDPQHPDLLMQYYPTVSVPTTSVQTVTLAQRAGSYLILTGTDNNGNNLTTLYDPSTDRETPIFSAANQIEIYHLSYVPATNTMLFDGLRFSDNTYVLGSVNLSNG